MNGRPPTIETACRLRSDRFGSPPPPLSSAVAAAPSVNAQSTRCSGGDFASPLAAMASTTSDPLSDDLRTRGSTAGGDPRDDAGAARDEVEQQAEPRVAREGVRELARPVPARYPERSMTFAASEGTRGRRPFPRPEQSPGPIDTISPLGRIVRAELVEQDVLRREAVEVDGVGAVVLRARAARREARRQRLRGRRRAV